MNQSADFPVGANRFASNHADLEVGAPFAVQGFKARTLAREILTQTRSPGEREQQSPALVGFDNLTPFAAAAYSERRAPELSVAGLTREAGERFSLSPEDRGGVRASVKHFCCSTALLGFAAMFLGATSLPAAEAKFKLRVATVAPRGSTFHHSFQSMGEKWKSAPGGGVELEIYPGTQGGEPTIVRRMNPRVAQLDGAMLTAVGMQQIDRSVTALQLMPMMFQSWDEVDFTRERLRPRLEKIFFDKGYVVLFWGDAGWVRFFSKKPIIHPADLKPLNVFASSGDPGTVELMKGYYNPVVLEPDKILTSLQTDMINTVPIPPFLANFLQVSGQTGNMLDLNFAPVVGAMVISRPAWDKLPPETQAFLRKAGEAAGVEIRRNSRNEDTAAIATMREKHHLKVHALPAGVQQEWEREIAKIYPKLRGSTVPADLFDEVQAALKEFRAGKAVPK